MTGKRTLFTAEEEKVKGGAKLTMLRAYVGIGETAKARARSSTRAEEQPTSAHGGVPRTQG